MNEFARFCLDDGGDDLLGIIDDQFADLGLAELFFAGRLRARLRSRVRARPQIGLSAAAEQHDREDPDAWVRHGSTMPDALLATQARACLARTILDRMLARFVMSLGLVPLFLAGLCSGVVVGPTMVLANAPVPAENAQPEPFMDQARALDEQGRGAFDSGDFLAAISAWTEAYYMLPPGVEYDRTRADLLRRLAEAHDRAYDLDGDIDHLELAVELLSTYLELLSPEDVANRELIADDREHADTRLEQAHEAIRAAQVRQQDNRRAYANARIRRMFTPNEKKALYTTGLAPASMDVIDVLEYTGHVDQAKRMRRRRRAQIAMYLTGAACLTIGGTLILPGLVQRVPLEVQLGVAMPMLSILSPGLLIGASFVSESFLEDENLDLIEEYNEKLQRQYEVENPNTIWARRGRGRGGALVTWSASPALLPGGVALGVRGQF